MHFTYADISSSLDLQQGDYLARTSEIEAILARYHPAFLKEDYRGYLVLTQTCDLVPDRPKTEFVTICAVRPLEAAISTVVNPLQTDFVLRKCNAVTERGYSLVSQFVERLLNNNEEQFFYLHEDAESSVSEKLCAFVRLSVAIQFEHYETCVAARRTRLKPEFQAKLGWHIGKIFNRVATDDWEPPADFKDQRNKIMREYVAQVEDKKAKKFRAENNEEAVAAYSEFEVRKMVQETPLPKKKDEVVTAAVNKLIENEIATEQDRRLITNLLANDSTISGLLRN